MFVVKNFFKMLGLHALCSVGCMMFIMMFPGIIDFKIGQVLYSILAISVFFDVYYTAAWSMANKEQKKIKISNNHLAEGQQPYVMSYTKGIVLAVAFAVLGVVIWALSFAFSVDNSGLSVAAFRMWYSEFIVAFMYSVRHIRHVSFVVAIVPAIAVISGYYCGVKNYNFIEGFVNKLVYKKKKEVKE